LGLITTGNDFDFDYMNGTIITDNLKSQHQTIFTTHFTQM